MNKIIRILREGMKSKLIIGTGEALSVPPNTSVDVEVPIELSKFLIKSVEVRCNKQTEFEVQFFEEPDRLLSRYNGGIVTGLNYDVLDLPYQDKEEEGLVYFTISNKSEYESSYNISIRGVGLK